MAETRRAPWSLAARLTAWYAASAFALVLVATAYLYVRLERELRREDEQVVLDRVAEMTSLLRRKPLDEAELEREVRREWSVSPGNRVLIRVVEADGRVVRETAEMSRVLPPPAAWHVASWPARPVTRDARSRPER